MFMYTAGPPRGAIRKVLAGHWGYSSRASLRPDEISRDFHATPPMYMSRRRQPSGLDRGYMSIYPSLCLAVEHAQHPSPANPFPPTKHGVAAIGMLRKSGGMQIKPAVSMPSLVPEQRTHLVEGSGIIEAAFPDLVDCAFGSGVVWTRRIGSHGENRPSPYTGLCNSVTTLSIGDSLMTHSPDAVSKRIQSRVAAHV